MEVSVRDLGRHRILIIHGDVDLYNVADLKNEINNNLQDDVQSIVIDLANTNYMDSSGIGALVVAKKKMSVKGGEFALLNIQESIFYILKLATLDKFFTIYQDESEIEA